MQSRDNWHWPTFVCFSAHSPLLYQVWFWLNIAKWWYQSYTLEPTTRSVAGLVLPSCDGTDGAQIKVLNLKEDEVRLLEMLILFAGSSNTSSVQAMDDGARASQDVIRTAQIQAISRRLVGMTRSGSKFPTYRRRFRQVVKVILAYSLEKEGTNQRRRSCRAHTI